MNWLLCCVFKKNYGEILSFVYLPLRPPSSSRVSCRTEGNQLHMCLFKINVHVSKYNCNAICPVHHLHDYMCTHTDDDDDDAHFCTCLCLGTQFPVLANVSPTSHPPVSIMVTMNQCAVCFSYYRDSILCPQLYSLRLGRSSGTIHALSPL